MRNTKVEIAGVTLKNPVMVSSGTFGSGEEYEEFFDLNKLGALVTKGVSLIPWSGNKTPRIAETDSGMLNAIGLQNPGIDVFLERDMPRLEKLDTVVIVNVCGHSEDEYLAVTEKLSDTAADMLEINISCPNVSADFLAFGQNPKMVEHLTSRIREKTKKPLIMKLTPNVTSIAEIARAEEAGGADAVSLINTLTGMKIDVERQTFALANKTGGLSGPAIRPVAVRMVYETARAVRIPVIGMGGITCAKDALEFILAGASAVSVGTANFVDPFTSLKVIEGMEEYMDRHGVKNIADLVGAVH
ncbi:MAG: dihydroorotate dehydrogenase [Lachnospiraceae bacterium]|nr:dihydroorotate dehydrogenase [Lachnospiraceae bacterium]